MVIEDIKRANAEVRQSCRKVTRGMLLSSAEDMERHFIQYLKSSWEPAMVSYTENGSLFLGDDSVLSIFTGEEICFVLTLICIYLLIKIFTNNC